MFMSSIERLFQRIHSGEDIEEISKFMQRNLLTPNTQDSDGDTVLHIAIETGRTDLALALLDFGACLNIPNNDGKTVLHYAAGRMPNIIPILVECGADVNACDSDGRTALFRLVECCAIFDDEMNDVFDAVQCLLEAGADPNVKDNIGWTPFLCAVIQRHRDDDNHRWGGMNGYHTLTETDDEYFNVNIVGLLLEYGADVNASVNMWTCLHYAAENGYINVLRFLVEAGADVNVSAFGQTPLHLAAEKGFPGIAWHLIDAGANIDVIDANGDTPMLCAHLDYQDWDIIRLLLKHNADLSIVNNYGQSFYDVAGSSALQYAENLARAKALALMMTFKLPANIREYGLFPHIGELAGGIK
jgi:ankyrin repeat protein